MTQVAYAYAYDGRSLITDAVAVKFMSVNAAVIIINSSLSLLTLPSSSTTPSRVYHFALTTERQAYVVILLAYIKYIQYTP